MIRLGPPSPSTRRLSSLHSPTMYQGLEPEPGGSFRKLGPDDNRGTDRRRCTTNSESVRPVVLSGLVKAGKSHELMTGYMPRLALKASIPRARTSPRPPGQDPSPGGSNTRILAIGGTGFIGRYVVGHLVNSGHDVAVFHRGTKETTLPSSVRHLHGDRERLAHFQNEFRDFAPDCVLAMALPAGNDQTGRERHRQDAIERKVTEFVLKVCQSLAITVQVSNRTRQSGFLCPAVKHGHIVSRIRQMPDNVSANETGSSDGENPRVASPWARILSPWPRRCPRSW